MAYVAFILVVIMAIRCTSYGIAAIKWRNIAGGIAAILLALGSIVCGFAVLY